MNFKIFASILALVAILAAVGGFYLVKNVRAYADRADAQTAQLLADASR